MWVADQGFGARGKRINPNKPKSPERSARVVSAYQRKQNMKQAELVPALIAGHKLTVGEFREHEVRALPAKNGAPPNVIATTFVLIGGREIVPVDTFQPKGTAVDAVPKPPYKVGQKLVVSIKSWGKTQWGLRVNGECSPLES